MKTSSVMKNAVVLLLTVVMVATPLTVATKQTSISSAVTTVDKAGSGGTIGAFGITSPMTVSISKGLGFRVSFYNNLGTVLYNISWSYHITGGIILHGASNSGMISSLAPCGIVKIHAYPIGFGRVSITVNASDANATTATAFLLVILTL